MGVLAYVLVLAWFLNHAQQIFGTKPDNFLAPAFMLIMFMVSACITGGLVLGLPIILYLDGQRRRAVMLLIYTISALIIIAILLALILVFM